jgi:hypothetical protein
MAMMELLPPGGPTIMLQLNSSNFIQYNFCSDY